MFGSGMSAKVQLVSNAVLCMFIIIARQDVFIPRSTPREGHETSCKILLIVKIWRIWMGRYSLVASD